MPKLYLQKGNNKTINILTKNKFSKIPIEQQTQDIYVSTIYYSLSNPV